MAVRIYNDGIVVPAQVMLQSAPLYRESAVSNGYVGTLKAFVSGLDLNAAAPIDLATLTVASSKYVPVRCIVYNPSGNMAAATLGLYTAAAAGGTNIVAPVLLATLTGVGKFQSLAIAALTDVITATTLFPRLTVASGVAGTASLMIEFVELGLI